MSAHAQTELTFYAPTATAGRNAERGDRREIKLCVWLHQISGERAMNVLGTFAARAYKCRFRAPTSLTVSIAPGWRAVDAANHEYDVRAVVENRGLYDLTLERV